MFILKLICCIGGTFIVAGVATKILNWLESYPIIEEPSTPLYITRFIYKDE